MAALERQRLPFDLLDGRRLIIPQDIKLLLLPSALCLKPEAAAAIQKFLQRGGWVYCEGGTGMFLENGFLQERPERRALLGALGIGALHRRGNHVDAACDVPAGAWAKSSGMTLKGALWSIAIDAPKSARVLAHDALGDAMLIEYRVGKGRLIMSGSFPSYSYGEKAYDGFEELIATLVLESGAAPRWRLTGNPELKGLSVRTGISGSKRLFFLLNAGSVKTVTVYPAGKKVGPVREWVTGKNLLRQDDGGVKIDLPDPSHRVIEWPVG